MITPEQDFYAGLLFLTILRAASHDLPTHYRKADLNDRIAEL